ncbi:MAG: hypothetical protein RLZZ458_2640, partial [Planctomycetota bacterium]
NFVNPVFWILQAASFFLRLLISRRAIDLLKGTPAILGMVTPFIITGWVAPDKQSQISRARSRASYFVERKEYEKADFYCLNWTILAPEDELAYLRRSEVLDLLKRPDEAKELLQALANRRGYLPAMLILCRREMQQVFSDSNVDPAAMDALEKSLQTVLSIHPGNNDAGFMLATLYISQEKYVEALELLQSITRSSAAPFPEAWYSQAALQQNLQRFDEARSSAAVAAEQFLNRHIRQPAATSELLQTIRALVIAQRENDALAIAESRIKLAKDPAEQANWTSLKGEICAAWSRRLRTRPNATPADHAQSLAILFQGIAVAPSQPAVIEELCALAISDRISSEDVGQHLETALNSGVSPGLVHFIQGTRYATQSPPDSTEADRHYKLAVEHDANFPGLLNNMANLISNSPDGNHEEALKLVDEALKQIPEQPQFLDTRGKLLLRLGKPQEALVNFEKALVDPSTRVEVHTNISSAWKALGDAEKAAYHKSIAEALQNASLPKN